MPSRTITVEIIGSSKSLQAALGRSTASLTGFAARADTVGKKLTTVGHTMTTHLTLPIVAAGAASVDLAVKFNHSMEMIKTQAGASQGEVTKMSKALLDMAQSGSMFSPDDLAKGLYHIESVGYRGAKALTTLKAAMGLAATGSANLEDTTSALTGVMVTNIKGTQNAARTAAILNATVGVGNMRMQDLVDAMGSQLAPVAKAAGMRFRDVAAALAMMTDEGVPAQVAANHLRTSLFMIADPTKKATAELKTLGLGTHQLGNDLRKPDGLMVAMQDLKTHMAGIQDPAKRLAALGNMFGGSRSASTIALLLNNLDRIGLKYDQIGKGASTFAADVAKTKQTPYAKLQIALHQLDAAGIKIGNDLIPVLVRFAPDVEKVAGAFSHLSKGQQEAALAIAGTVAALGPAVGMIGTVAKLASMISRLNTAMTIGAASGKKLAPVLTEDGVAAEGAAGSFGLLGPAAILAAGGLAAWYHSTKPNVTMSASAAAALAKLQVTVDAGGKSAKGYANANKQVGKVLGEVQGAYLKLAHAGVDQNENLNKARANVKLFAADMVTLAAHESNAAAAAQKLTPQLAAVDRAAAGDARAAAQIALAIGRIPSHKSVVIALLEEVHVSGGPQNAGLPGYKPIIPPIKKPPAKHRAAGGPVYSAMAYTVGERGPETFVPSQTGTIIPNLNFSGGRSGSSIAPAAVGNRSETFEAHITNWDTGTIRIRRIAREEVNGAKADRIRAKRMGA